MMINTNVLYPLADESTTGKSIMAMPTGEFREPKKGEWYLSGAIVEAYKARNDLTTKYWIAKRVKVEECIRVTKTLEG
jgi:hypothetical protein